MRVINTRKIITYTDDGMGWLVYSGNRHSKMDGSSGAAQYEQKTSHIIQIMPAIVNNETAAAAVFGRLDGFIRRAMSC